MEFNSYVRYLTGSIGGCVVPYPLPFAGTFLGFEKWCGKAKKEWGKKPASEASQIFYSSSEMSKVS